LASTTNAKSDTRFQALAEMVTVIESANVRNVMSSNIEWTDATWNPATGCSKVSPGCKNCYAETLSIRLKAMKQKKYVNGFKYTEHEEELQKPIHWKKPRMIFVNSMSDLFHEDATDSFIDAVFEIMMTNHRHTYQVLTKRPKRMREFVDKFISVRGGLHEIPKHIWLGTSIENKDVMHRLDELKNVKCKIKFVSFEPLLEMVMPDLEGINWAIVGGESGAHARRIEKDWIQIIQKLCTLHDTAFFFKQWGGRFPKERGSLLDGKKYQEFPKID